MPRSLFRIYFILFQDKKELLKFSKLISLWLPLVIYLGLIYYFSSLSQIKIGLHAADFPLHLAEYFVLSVLIFRALNFGLRERASLTVILFSLLLSIAYAVLDEIHQAYVPNRNPSQLDLIADGLGAILGLFAIVVYQRGILPRRVKKQ